MRMNKEQQELLDEAFNQFSKYKMENFDDMRWDVIIEMNISDNTKPYFVTGRPLIKEEFINKCKTDTEFSERWGLKIEQRELNLEERVEIARKALSEEKFNEYGYLSPFTTPIITYWLNQYNIPTKLITVTYNDIKIESYE
jgi:hypothetical protein